MSDIIKDAELKAARIIDEATAEARSILEHTKTFIEASHTPTVTPLSFICSSDSRIGDILDFVLGEAKSCYCCSAIRMGLIGFVVGAILSTIASYIYYLL